MQAVPSASLKQRADAIRLPVTVLAERAGLDEMTAHRVLRGKSDPRESTLLKLDRALAREEDKLFEYLAPLVVPRREAAE
jgi:transcriptional regulator with XRE-family HTH domain